MSGHKRATVALNQDDFARLRQAEERLRTVEKDYQDIQERVKHIHTQELQQSFEQVQDRQLRFQQALSGVDDDLSAIEWNTSQALLAHWGQVQQQVGQLSGQVFEDTAALVEASSQRLEAGLEQLSLQHQDQINTLQHSLRQLHRSRQAKEQLAGQSLASAQALFEALAATYSLPPEAQVLALELDNAQANLANGFFEAALLGAQQSVLRLSDLRLRIEQELARRQRLLASVLAQARELYETGLRSQQVTALDLDGNPLDFSVDLTFWSGGAYQAWLSRGQGLLRQLEAQGQTLDLPDLERLLAQELPALQGSLQDLVYQARLNVIASQVRFNIAACIVQALQEQGFELSEASYDSADQRAAYQATVRAFDGSEVVVYVSPQPGQAAATQIDLLSHDRELRTEHELRQRAREMAFSLQSFGLQVGKISAPVPEPAVPERRAPYTVRQPSVSPLLAPGEGEEPSPYTYPDTPAALQTARRATLSQPHLSKGSRRP